MAANVWQLRSEGKEFNTVKATDYVDRRCKPRASNGGVEVVPVPPNVVVAPGKSPSFHCQWPFLVSAIIGRSVDVGIWVLLVASAAIFFAPTLPLAQLLKQ